MGRKKKEEQEAPQAADTQQSQPVAAVATAAPVAAEPAAVTPAGQDTLTDEEFEAMLANQRKMREVAKSQGRSAPMPPQQPAAPAAPAPAASAPAPVAPPQPPAPSVPPPQPPSPKDLFNPRSGVPAPAASLPQSPAVPPSNPSQPIQPSRPAPIGVRTAGAPMQPKTPVAAAPQQPTAPVVPASPAPQAIVQAAPVQPTNIVTAQTLQAAGLPVIGDGEYPMLSSDQMAFEAMRYNMGSGFGFNEWQLPRIRLPRGGGIAWEISTPEGIVPAKEFWGIILFFKDQLSFWAHAIDETGGHVPPDCQSDDGVIGRGNPGGECKKCPWFQWGSRVKQRPQDGNTKGKACRHSSIIFVAQPGQMLPSVVMAPPTSLTNFKKYMLNLASQRQPYFSVETYFGLVQQQVGAYVVAMVDPQRSRVLTTEQSRKVLAAQQSMVGLFTSTVATQSEVEADGDN